jgi:subtilisin family serine protease
VDYTHADFRGAGTAAAYEANDPTVVEPGTFPTARVVGGTDFVGDAYAAEDPANSVPKPDPDPLDCDGHGTHVAGIAAGNGVLADGTAYPGPYDATTHRNAFGVGPGVAPDALIYAYKVFGCEGSVDNSIVVDALNRALADGVDVVNMSLGSDFGSPGDPEADTVNTLAEAGVVVVASAGNSGAGAYITGNPAAADRAISVAAMDASREQLPGALATFSSGGTLHLQDSNEAPLPAGALPVMVLSDGAGGIGLGCEAGDYAAAAGKVVVTLRGVCDRVARARFGQQAGAAAVIMVNTDQAFPPMEGPIEGVTIPFLGATGTPETTALLTAADGGTVTFAAEPVPNPGFRRLASFTSGGPRNGDSAPKPDVTAPGVAVVSAGAGTGAGPATISGTSQSSPFTAGVAALVTQVHPDWTTERVKSAIMNTAEPTLLLDHDVRLGGAGVVQAQRAVDTVSVALAGAGQSALAFGAEALRSAYRETRSLRIVNTGATSLTYDVAGSFQGEALGAALTASPARVTVAAGGTRTVAVTLSLSAADVAALPAAETSDFGELVTIRGEVVAVPTTAGAGVYPLRVPFLVAPRGLSDIRSQGLLRTRPAARGDDARSAALRVANGGIHAGAADFYAWGVLDRAGDTPTRYVDVRAAGVQVLPGSVLEGADGDRSLVFAVNMAGGWSTPSVAEVDVPIDHDGDGTPDAWLIAIDLGIIAAGAPDGTYAVAVTDADFNIRNVRAAVAPMNGSTMLLPALASEIGRSTADGSFSYSIQSFDLLFGEDSDETAAASFDLASPAVSSGQFVELAPGQRKDVDIDFDPAAVQATGTRGWMVVTLDDAAGRAQADLVRVPRG